MLSIKPSVHFVLFFWNTPRFHVIKKYSRFTPFVLLFSRFQQRSLGAWVPIVATEDGIVAKHNVVVLWAMKATHCCMVQRESGVLFDMKWVIPLRKGISSI